MFIFEKQFVPTRKDIENNEVKKLAERLTCQLVDHTGLKHSQLKRSRQPSLELPFRNYAIYYEEDEIMTFSLMRSFRISLENELCGDLNRISKILIEQK